MRWVHSKNTEHFIRPFDLVRLDVPFPTAHMGNLLGLFQVCFVDAQRAFHLHARGNVAEVDDDGSHAWFVEQIGEGALYPNPGTVFAPEAVLKRRGLAGFRIR